MELCNGRSISNTSIKFFQSNIYSPNRVGGMGVGGGMLACAPKMG